MMRILKFIIIAISTLSVVACHRVGGGSRLSGEQDVRLAPGEYVVDEPESVTDYFETLCNRYGAEVAVHIDDYDDSLKVWQAVRLLDDYVAGRRVYYPADEVRHALDELAFELGYRYDHGVDEEHLELFFFRLLEQAVRLSPKLELVTDFHSSDGTAGILNYHEWAHNPMYSFLVYPTDKGLRVRMIGEVLNTRIEKLFHLTDSMGREYYLCSNNGSLDYQEDFIWLFFRQYLYMRDGDDLREVASYTGLDSFVPEDFDGTVVFNPRLLRWDCCRQSGDVFVRIDGTSSLRLHLDGNRSRFIVIE